MYPSYLILLFRYFYNTYSLCILVTFFSFSNKIEVHINLDFVIFAVEYCK
jgi:hypothetical protein